MKKLLLLLVTFSVMGCISDDPISVEVDGMKPVYISDDQNFVAVQEPRDFGKLGKIVYVDPYLMINEQFEGIHIVDNTNPASPRKLSFIKIPGNTDFTIKSGYLYANQGADFKAFSLGTQESSSLGLDFLDLQIEETCVIPSFFANQSSNQDANGLFPPNYSGFFECVDPSKGFVINWEETRLFDPECRI